MLQILHVARQTSATKNVEFLYPRMVAKVQINYTELDEINDKLANYQTQGLLDGFAELLNLTYLNCMHMFHDLPCCKKPNNLHSFQGCMRFSRRP